MNKDALKKILNAYKTKRIEENLAVEQRYLLACNNPEFEKADTEIKKLNFEIAKIEVANGDASDLYKKLDQAQKARKNALKSLNMSEKDLLPKFTCPICKDTGYTSENKLCSCVKQKLIDILRENCGMSGALNFRFGDNNFKIFEGTKQEKSMTSLYKTMELFCEKFPHTKHINVLLCGPTGVGKSYLISAIANCIMEKGYSVMYLSAFEFNDLVLKYHTSPIDVRNNYIDGLMTSDLLIIDDLGTEPIRKNVSIDYLYSIMSHRMEHGLHTVFSTNLDADNLLQRYGERVFSRLFHKKHTIAKRITGDDLRIKK